MTAILSLVGVVIGFFLQQITIFFNDKKADKKVLKQTLFFLLEIHHKVSVAQSVEAFSESYFRSFVKRHNVIEIPEDLNDGILRQIIRTVVGPLLNPKIEMDLKELSENYEKCILLLSTFDPVNAYRLKGQNKIISDLSKLSNYAAETMISNLPNAEYVKKFSEQISLEMTSTICLAFLEHLRKTIETTAKRIDKNILKGVKDVLSRQIMPQMDETTTKSIDGIILSAFEKLKSNESAPVDVLPLAHSALS